MLNCCHARFSDVTDNNRPRHNQQSTARFTKNVNYIMMSYFRRDITLYIVTLCAIHQPFAWHFFVTFVWLAEVAFTLNHVHNIYLL